ncbi:MAG: AMP-binding protein, partial [Deltaproteobacteria bacterium]|nr:AMP-binding protein [Deltaproteobacteria bacterium]
LPSGKEWILSQYAIWQAGGVAVPLSPKDPPAILKRFVYDCDAQIIIVPSSHKSFFQSLFVGSGILVLSSDELRQAQTEKKKLPVLTDDRDAMVLYTSGTTGNPKGVVLTHRNLEARLKVLLRGWEWTSADRIAQFLPLNHVHGILGITLPALAAGARVDMMPKFDAAEVWRKIRDGELTLLMGVPTIYMRLIEYWEKQTEDQRAAMSAGAKKLRLVLSGSSSLPGNIRERWSEITGTPLRQRYGTTEIGIVILQPIDGEFDYASIGVPVPGLETRVVDDEGRPMPEGVEGNLEVRGSTVFDRYLNNPEATAASRTADGWFKTGDRVTIREGRFYFGFRAAAGIKSGGEFVSPTMVENALLEDERVSEAYVVGVPDAKWGERVCALVVLKEGVDPTSVDFKPALRETLPPQAIPKNYLFVPAGKVPKNHMGKPVLAEIKKLFEVELTRADPTRLDGLKMEDGSQIRVLRELVDFPDDPEIRAKWDRHYAVFEISNPELGYTAYMAVHRLTPIQSKAAVLDGQWRATGGTRMLVYRDGVQGALRDAMELSVEMSYKVANLGLRIVGSKCALHVTGFNPKTREGLDGEKRKAVLKSYALAIERIGNAIGGGVLTGQDLNISFADAEYMHQFAPTSIVPCVGGDTCRDPVPATSIGVFAGMRFLADQVWEKFGSIRGKVVAIQGIGGVGGELIKYLLDAGAIVIGSDIDRLPIVQLTGENSKAIRENRLFLFVEGKTADGYTQHILNPLAHFPGIKAQLHIMGIDNIDIFSPCAMGGVLNDESIPILQEAGVKLVCGSANDQCRDKKRHPQMMLEAGMTYGPDYVVNAGGVLVVDGHLGQSITDTAVDQKVGSRVKELYEKAKAEGVPIQVIADREALAFYEKLPHAPLPEWPKILSGGGSPPASSGSEPSPTLGAKALLAGGAALTMAHSAPVRPNKKRQPPAGPCFSMVSRNRKPGRAFGRKSPLRMAPRA